MLGLGIGVSHSNDGGGWTPAELTGLVGWYRYNTDLVVSGGSTFPDNGEDIGRWRDQSGNSNDASKADDVPSYDKVYESVFFDSTAETLDIPQLTLGEFAIYVRMRFTDTSINTSDILMKDDTTAYNFWRIQTTTGIRCKIGGSSSLNYTLHSSTTLAADSWYNMGLERDADSDIYSYLNGVANGSAHNEDLESRPFLVDSIHGGQDVLVSEVIITTSALTSAERELVDTWLSSETEG